MQQHRNSEGNLIKIILYSGGLNKAADRVFNSGYFYLYALLYIVLLVDFLIWSMYMYNSVKSISTHTTLVVLCKLP